MIFFDMDGVLVNFNKKASEVHNRPYNNNTEYMLEDEWGISSKEFWKPIDALGGQFWVDLEPYEWFDELIALANDTHRIATTPSHAPSATEGKVQSIQKLFGSKFRRYFITPEKWLLGGINRILIDDLESNCEKFERQGGTAILFPQSYNMNKHLVNDRMEYIKEEIQSAMFNKFYCDGASLQTMPNRWEKKS